MSFHTGSVSYARFQVTGSPPANLDQSLLDTLAAHTLKTSGIGAPEEIECGWVAGRHVFDEKFEVETIGYGDRLLLGMRVDTNRVPSELKRAYRSMAEAELAAGSPTGFLHRGEKLAAKEAAADRCRNEMIEGRHRKSKLVPILWDLRRQLIFMPGFSDAVVKGLGDLLHKSFACGVQALSAGALASQWCAERGLSREYEDVKPSAFTPPPAAAVNDDDRDLRTPSVPWSRQDPEPKDYLGNEFLLWLWHECVRGTGLIDASPGTTAVVLDHALDLDCAWDATGKMTLRADRVTRQGEALHALRAGKWPRRAGLVVAAGDSGTGGWAFTFQADRFLLTGIKLPRWEDDAATPRDLIEQRVESLIDLDETMMGLFHSFMEQRMGNHWSRLRHTLGAWMRGRDKVIVNPPAQLADVMSPVPAV